MNRGPITRFAQEGAACRLPQGPITTTVWSVKASGIHRLLALALAVWLPFCCCQARAVASAVLDGRTTSAGACMGDRPACCRARVAHSDETTAPTDDGRSSSQPCERCPSCLSTKDRAPAPPAPELDRDTVGQPDPVLCAVPSAEEHQPGARAEANPTTFRGDPPWRVAGRRALERHQTLVI